MYGGVQYRSRLEARYAAFFYFLGWHYEYEPFDLCGWVPDFALIGDNETVLVEVKPYTQASETEETKRKIIRALSGVNNEVLLAGAFCRYASAHDGWTCGWLLERTWFPDVDYDNWNEAVIIHSPPGACRHDETIVSTEHRYGLIHNLHSFHDRINGLCHKCCDADKTYQAWDAAGNVVQWLP
jgi:hypothetical protein